MVRIRKAKQEDIARIGEITAVAWAENTLYKLLEDRHGLIGNRGWQERKVDDMKNFCTAHLDRVFVAVENGLVVGYATFDFNEEDKVGQVCNNAVDPDHRGKGIGTSLIVRVIDELKTLGARVLRVTTLAHDLPAQRIYEKLGFKEIARSVYYTMEVLDRKGEFDEATFLK